MSEEPSKVLPFIEHLIELRRRLIIIVIAVFIGMGFAWNLADDILVYMEKPLTGITYIDAAKQQVYRYLQTNYPPSTSGPTWKKSSTNPTSSTHSTTPSRWSRSLSSARSRSLPALCWHCR